MNAELERRQCQQRMRHTVDRMKKNAAVTAASISFVLTNVDNAKNAQRIPTGMREPDGNMH